MAAIKLRRSQSSDKSLFRGRSRRLRYSIIRQLIESIIMLLSGTFILVFINNIPNRDKWYYHVAESLSQLYDILSILFNSILVIFAVIVSLTLILGSIIRIIRVILLRDMRKSNQVKGMIK